MINQAFRHPIYRHSNGPLINIKRVNYYQVIMEFSLLKYSNETVHIFNKVFLSDFRSVAIFFLNKLA